MAGADRVVEVGKASTCTTWRHTLTTQVGCSLIAVHSTARRLCRILVSRLRCDGFVV